MSLHLTRKSTSKEFTEPKDHHCSFVINLVFSGAKMFAFIHSSEKNFRNTFQPKVDISPTNTNRRLFIRAKRIEIQNLIFRFHFLFSSRKLVTAVGAGACYYRIVDPRPVFCNNFSETSIVS